MGRVCSCLRGWKSLHASNTCLLLYISRQLIRCYALWVFGTHVVFAPLLPHVISRFHHLGRPFHLSLLFQAPPWEIGFRREVHLPANGSVLNSLCLFNYLDTMVIGAIETERSGRRNREREHPKHQGAGKQCFVTLVFIWSWQCYLSCPPCTDLSPGNVCAGCFLTHLHFLGLDRRDAAFGIIVTTSYMGLSLAGSQCTFRPITSLL